MTENMENTIAIPVYKTGKWTDDVTYLICQTKIKDIKLPAKVGYYDSEQLVVVPFEINLN